MSHELIYGIHAVSALLERQPERFLEAWVLKGREDERLLPLINELQRCGVSIQLVTRKTLMTRRKGPFTRESSPASAKAKNMMSRISGRCWTSNNNPSY